MHSVDNLCSAEETVHRSPYGDTFSVNHSAKSTAFCLFAWKYSLRILWLPCFVRGQTIYLPGYIWTDRAEGASAIYYQQTLKVHYVLSRH